ncbi:MAG: DUF4215 domain-containing protein [Deltaproteobacteria bacterium]|nr:DUF4215 domain-containing protein [Deltaproteobacteria bacterium]
MKNLLTTALILFFLVPASWASQTIGPRREMNWLSFTDISENIWSGYIEIKLSEELDYSIQELVVKDSNGKEIYLLESLGATASSPTFGRNYSFLKTLKTTGEINCRCTLADLTKYYRIDFRNSKKPLSTLLKIINSLDFIEVAYPLTIPVPPPEDIPPVTPSYAEFQGYFSESPIGTGIESVRDIPGSRGEGITIVDIEYNWNKDHEDLENCINALIPDAGTLYAEQAFVDHGTSVLGIIFGSHNGYGITGAATNGLCGFSPDYTYEYGYNVARGITNALENFPTGSIFLLEAQEYGPNYDDSTYAGLVPVEWIPATYDAIRTAVSNGYIIVEAGANGWENLDDPVYNNAFDKEISDSGAIMVGAGLPGTNPQARSREWYSNYGSRMDVQAWGSQVYSTGYGDLFTGGGDVNQYYTSEFGGTSSASPIVTGTIAVLLGILRASGSGADCSSTECTNGETCDDIYFDPPRCISATSFDALTIRDLLISTGIPQTGDTSENIGPFPDIETALTSLNSECGNGILEGLEICDDGNTLSGDGCSENCKSTEVCGNSIVDINEICDDGNTLSGDGCSEDCKSTEVCGNSIIDINEACDDGNTLSGDGCSEDCKSTEVCGNSIVDINETCDDGNTLSGDGCSEDCKNEKTEDNGCGCSAAGKNSQNMPSVFLLLILFFLLFHSRLKYLNALRGNKLK